MSHSSIMAPSPKKRITAAEMRIARYYADRLRALLWGLMKKWGRLIEAMHRSWPPIPLRYWRQTSSPPQHPSSLPVVGSRCLEHSAQQGEEVFVSMGGANNLHFAFVRDGTQRVYRCVAGAE